uniref:Secreted protein n=1 Tax=Knipowitschia caucasica TaxID=637954 RepID=A0AAV2IWR1_KNICA
MCVAWCPADMCVAGVLQTCVWLVSCRHVWLGVLQTCVWCPADMCVVSCRHVCGVLQTCVWCPADMCVVSCRHVCGWYPADVAGSYSQSPVCRQVVIAEGRGA